MVVLKDREEAGRLLAERLGAYRDDPNALILALPRGGVAVGYTLSLALHLPLDVLIVRKLGAPGNPEYAVGAVAEGGALYLNREGLRDLGLVREDLDQSILTQEAEIVRRQTLYRGGRSLPAMTGRTILLVDDGI
ncbi:MAG: erythromycin esterase, partial [Nitrospirota bacterium]|nr:erythromycin esterase [Nitrospirota bacterium]